jgi:hypothetical protein
MNERMNIRRMQVPEQKKEQVRPFDPLKEITQGEWQKMRDELAIMREERDSQEYAQLGANMKILNPEEGFTIGRSTWAWEPLWNDLAHSKEEEMWEGFVQTAALMKIIDPSFSFPLSEKDKEDISQLWQTKRDIYKLHELARANIFYPEGRRRWDRSEWEYYASIITNRQVDSSNWTFAQFASNLRLACPEYDLPLTGSDWVAMRGDLDSSRAALKQDPNDDPDYDQIFKNNFVNMAVYMTILAADRIEITDEGLQLINSPESKNLQTKVGAIPDSLQL